MCKLKKDVKLPLSLDQIIPYNKLQSDYNAIKDFLVEQGFKTVLQRLESNTFIFKNKESVQQSQEKEVKYYTISKIEELKKQKTVKKIIDRIKN